MKLKKIVKKPYKLACRIFGGDQSQAGPLQQRHVDYIEEVIEKVALNQDFAIYKKNIEAVSVSDLDSEAQINQAADILAREGILIVPGYFDTESASSAQAVLRDQLVKELQTQGGEEDEERENLFVHRSGEQFTSYSALQNYHKAVVNIRRGKDEGMIDVFNVDYALPGQLTQMRGIFENQAILSVIEKSGYEALSPDNLNAYVNRGITKTRGFHIDSPKHTLKGFMYLTDVKQLDDGPYCYVRGTHKHTSTIREINPALAAQSGRKHTDSPFIDPYMVTPVLANKGDLVLSDQAGVHRGIPQREDAERYMAVMRYK